MLFNYVAIDPTNIQREGTVEAPNIDSAITAVQKRGYKIVSINPVDEGSSLASIFNIELELFGSVSNKEIVILSRQISTLFEAHVSPLRIFRLLSVETDNPQLRKAMNDLFRHNHIFSQVFMSISCVQVKSRVLLKMLLVTWLIT
jgi:type II secretory pathway component PulF